ncbi:MAG: DUF1284 domain-containing protein [Nitrospirales bacterium]|nr:DUF1284 domain-containing protein [Nitrospirales bacterium]
MQELRGHHLICLHFYRGEGYDEAFIMHLERVMAEVRREGVRVSTGPDAICLSCPHLSNSRCIFSPEADEEIGSMDKKALELLGLEEGMEAQWQSIEQRIPCLFAQWYDSFCSSCSWQGACSKNEGFRRLIRERT